MRTNNLCADIGYMSLNHEGESLCGDHVEMIETEDKPSTVIVLADGLGSGVKASILSTLTSKIISTMIAAGLRLEDCVETIAATLPVCSVRGVAYSTFTIMRIVNNRRAEIIQYDNPKVILLRNGENIEYPVSRLDIGGKSITRADIALCEGDVFIAMSDGVEHAGVGVRYNFGWKRSDIIEFMKTFVPVGFTARTLTKILLDECGQNCLELLKGGRNLKTEVVKPVLSPDHGHRNLLHRVGNTIVLAVVEHCRPQIAIDIIGITVSGIVRSLLPDCLDRKLCDDSAIN